MARSLYEIDHEIAELFDSETGEIGEEALLRLTELEMERDQKIEGVACAVKNLTAEAAMYKAEAKAFAERQKQAEATIARLKKWLVDATGGSEILLPPRSSYLPLHHVGGGGRRRRASPLLSADQRGGRAGQGAAQAGAGAGLRGTRCASDPLAERNG